MHPPPVKVSLEQNEILSAPLSKKELLAALKTTKHNKSPGPDGLPADYYMMFWRKIGDLLHDAFVDSFQKGCLYICHTLSIGGWRGKAFHPRRIRERLGGSGYKLAFACPELSVSAARCRNK